MRLLVSFSALFLSVLFVQMGLGALRPFDTISGQALNFSSVEIGLIASGHFAGFLIGCIVSPRLALRVGHSRSFVVMVSIATITIVAHPLFPDPYIWAFIRVGSGFAVAGCYTVIESWLQAKLTNKIRGRIFGVYRMVDLSGQLLANGIIAILTPASYVSYNIIAIVMCLSALPLAMTQSKEPALPRNIAFKPLVAFHISPLATLGVVVAGISTAAFGSVAPIYAVEMGLSIGGVAVFLIVSILGGMVSQVPAGMLADRLLSRRSVLMLFSILATITCIGMSTQLTSLYIMNIPAIHIFAFLFGFTTFPIYSVCAAHANDFAARDQILNLSASLIFFYAVGAIVSPLVAGYIIDNFGASMMFVYISLAHIVLLFYTIYRNFIRPAVKLVHPYAYVPRTTLFIANILRNRGGTAKK
ncbi:MFS transporter [Alphaproteobacteria bacterium]|nr:MFS transporter [Alphaproteobacteria bacterium]